MEVLSASTDRVHPHSPYAYVSRAGGKNSTRSAPCIRRPSHCHATSLSQLIGSIWMWWQLSSQKYIRCWKLLPQIIRYWHPFNTSEYPHSEGGQTGVTLTHICCKGFFSSFFTPSDLSSLDVLHMLNHILIVRPECKSTWTVHSYDVLDITFGNTSIFYLEVYGSLNSELWNKPIGSEFDDV